jgi:hypothetical protein
MCVILSRASYLINRVFVRRIRGVLQEKLRKHLQIHVDAGVLLSYRGRKLIRTREVAP